MAKPKNYKDKVEITSYGQTKVWERGTAINEFKEAVYFCDGCEQMRYSFILAELLNGKTKIDDRNAFRR